jgi:hypothetical protein
MDRTCRRRLGRGPELRGAGDRAAGRDRGRGAGTRGLPADTTGALSVIDSNFLPGDFNRDGHVDAADFLPAMKALTNPTGYEAQYGVSPADLQIIGDLNGDTKFTNADLQFLLVYLKSGGGSTSTVPEPASLVLLSVGALAIAICRRSRSTVGK